MSANRWRRALAAGGRTALASEGAVGAKYKLAPAQLRELVTAGPPGPSLVRLKEPGLQSVFFAV